MPLFDRISIDTVSTIPTDPPLAAEEDRCGNVGPKGFLCRLRRGHTPSELHAGLGETWSGEHDGWTPPSMKEIPRLVEASDDAERAVLMRRQTELLERATRAGERTADALEGIRLSLEHFVEESFHKVRGS